MRIVEDYTGLAVSRLTTPTRLFVGCCIIVLAPILALGSFS
ncbi:hypothetical protein [Sphingobium sp.]|nr:hypothetical protein [Sphingobium sp.]HUD94854.1 hypothetical protein [Sphingobium sp.]